MTTVAAWAHPGFEPRPLEHCLGFYYKSRSLEKKTIHTLKAYTLIPLFLCICLEQRGNPVPKTFTPIDPPLWAVILGFDLVEWATSHISKPFMNVGTS